MSLQNKLSFNPHANILYTSISFFLPYSSSGLCRRKLLATISLHDAAMVADTALEQNEFGGTLQGDPKGSSAGQEAGL